MVLIYEYYKGNLQNVKESKHDLITGALVELFMELRDQESTETIKVVKINNHDGLIMRTDDGAEYTFILAFPAPKDYIEEGEL